MSVHIHVYISTNLGNNVTETQVDISMHAFIHIYYTRYVIGRSWVRVPQGVNYFPKYRFEALLMAHTQTHIYIYISLTNVVVCLRCLPILICILGNTSAVMLRKPMQTISVCYLHICICIYKQTYAYTIRTLRASIKHLKMEAVVIYLYTSRGRGIETCGIDYVFPPHDLWFGSDNNKNCTRKVIYIHIYYWYSRFCLISNHCTKLKNCACTRLQHKEWSCAHAILLTS